MANVLFTMLLRVMTIQDLGSIGELLSSVFVLVTLIYLAVQVRHSRELLEENRKITMSQVYEGRAFYRGNLAKELIDPVWASVYVKLRGGVKSVPPSAVIENYDKLTDEEKVISIMQQQAVTQGIDNSLYQIELGLVDETGAQGSYDYIREDFPLWAHSKIPIPPRIVKWYEENGEHEDV